MSEERRLLLAILIAIAIYSGWSWLVMARRKEFLAKHPPPAPQSEVQKTPAPPPPPSVGHAANAAVPAAPKQPEQLVALSTPELSLVFSSRGGTLAHAVLRKAQYRRRVAGKDVPVDLVRGAGGTGQALAIRFEGASWPDDPDADYAVEKDPSGGAVTFRRVAAGATITKRYEAVAPYLLSMHVTVTGGSAKVLAVTYSGEQPPQEKGKGGFLGHLARSYPNVATAICRVDGTNKSSGSDKDQLVTLPAPPGSAVVQFGGIDERFFVAAVTPQGIRQGSCSISSTKGGRVEAEIDLPEESDKPIDRIFGVFLGPKDLDLLTRASRLPRHQEDAELATSIGFGFWTALCVPMLRALQIFYRVIPNWGIAILVLTILMRLLLWPLNHAQYKSMEKMKALQPKMAEMKEKYGKDKERLNVEMMKVYTENKVNPLGGCLPMLVQLPIWWALYRLLGTTIQLYRQPFIPGWINDLTAPDPFFALPIFMGVTMAITTLLSPKLPDSGQQRLMMWLMPAMMTFFFLNLPAGLNLYIVASNLLSIAQQAWVRSRSVPLGPPG